MIARGFRLRKATDFQKTYKFGKSFNNQNLYIKVLRSNLPNSRVAVVVPKKVSKRAVVRNRARRRVYEILRVNWPKIQPGYTIIITAKNDLSDLSPSQLQQLIISGIEKLTNQL